MSNTSSDILKVEVAIGGMTCGACSTAITNGLKALPGVISVDVSLITERANVTAQNLTVNEIVEAIEDCGFDANVIKSHVSKPEPETNNDLQGCRIVIDVGGMTCGSCTNSIRSAVNALDFVSQVDVSLATDQAYVDCFSIDDRKLDELLTTIEDAGFDAKVAKKVTNDENYMMELSLFGLNETTNYEELIDELEGLDGVFKAEVDRLTGTAFISYDRDLIGIRTVSRAIEQLGYTAISANLADNSHQIESLSRARELKRYYYDTIKTATSGLPVFIMIKFRSHLPKFLTAKGFRGVWIDDILNLILVLPIILGPARGFYIKSYKAIKAGSPTMDVLVSVSVTSAFAYSMFMLLHSIISNAQHHKMYLWDACTMILSFVLFGKYLENMARGQTTRALAELISLFPENALVIAKDTPPEGETLPVDLLQYGDLIVLRPGEKVSADGVVVEGESFVTESLITGESEPVRKVEGDRVYGGTINGSGCLKFKVTECGSETKLSQIVQFVKDAQALSVPIQRYTDAISAKFVPCVIGLSLLTFLGWYMIGKLIGVNNLPMLFRMDHLGVIAFRLAISVVVVACPCALGLATPTAVMVGTGAGARHGILIKGGGVFELGSQASVVLFDKTGTLTMGKVQVSHTTIPAEHWPAVRTLESMSEHLIGRALASFIHPLERGYDDNNNNNNNEDSSNKLAVTDFKSIVGVGIEGNINGKRYFIGQHESDGIALLIDGELIGTVNIQDSIRSDSYLVVENLQSQGYKVGIVSGDGKSAVDNIAKELGVSSELTWSRMKPEDKVDIVRKLQDEGHVVVFVGDGVNDSPALAVSSVGISLEGATHVAVESADVVLTQVSPISAVPAVLDLCKCTMRRIKMNLFSSIFYNAIMIPFAMGFFLHWNLKLSPAMASAAMALSSVSVVCSSLMLRSWEPKSLDPFEPGKPKFWSRVWSKLTFWRSRGVQYAPV